MRAEDVRAVLKATPLQPFRVRMASGQTFDIPNAEFMKYTRTTAFIFLAPDANGIPDRTEIVSVELIESVQPIEPAPSV